MAASWIEVFDYADVEVEEEALGDAGEVVDEVLDVAEEIKDIFFSEYRAHIPSGIMSEEGSDIMSEDESISRYHARFTWHSLVLLITVAVSHSGVSIVGDIWDTSKRGRDGLVKTFGSVCKTITNVPLGTPPREILLKVLKNSLFEVTSGTSSGNYHSLIEDFAELIARKLGYYQPAACA